MLARVSHRQLLARSAQPFLALISIEAPADAMPVDESRVREFDPIAVMVVARHQRWKSYSVGSKRSDKGRYIRYAWRCRTTPNSDLARAAVSCVNHLQD